MQDKTTVCTSTNRYLYPGVIEHEQGRKSDLHGASCTYKMIMRCKLDYIMLHSEYS